MNGGKKKKKRRRIKESANVYSEAVNSRSVKFVSVNRNKQCCACGKVFKTATYRKHHEQNVHGIEHGIDEKGRRKWTREYD